MKKVTINNNMYLGTIVRTNKKTYLKSALQITGPEVTNHDIEEYICKKNMGTLETDIELIGNGMHAMISGLSKLQKIHIKRCKISMEFAKESAVPTMENKIFTEVMGK